MAGEGIGSIIGSVVGSLGRGMGGGMGGGGMGGGMMGGGGMGGGMMGGMGGMMGGNAQNTSGAQGDQSSYDVYDVDRWKRSDGMDETTSNVQMVRDAWDLKAAEKKAARQEKSLLKRSRRKMTGFFARKEKKAAEEAMTAELERARTGTIHTSAMKKAEHNIESAQESPVAAALVDADGNRVGPETPAAASPAAPVDAMAQALAVRGLTHDRSANYLGLGVISGIDGFVTSNPMNSVILAVDSLSFGSLTLNQVKPVQVVKPLDRIIPAPVEGEKKLPETDGKTKPSSGTDYMNAFREERENRKYDVHIV